MGPFRQPLFNISTELSSGKNASESNNELSLRKNLNSLVNMVRVFNPSQFNDDEREDYENAVECMIEELGDICQDVCRYYTYAESTKRYNARNGCNNFLSICNQLNSSVNSVIKRNITDKESSLYNTCERFTDDMQGIIKDLKSFKE